VTRARRPYRVQVRTLDGVWRSVSWCKSLPGARRSAEVWRLEGPRIVDLAGAVVWGPDD
jgi:hypothetical protein